MCILCVVQRWSRRVATMLPWLVLPLIFLWMLSQLLPPNLRFEVTSPRVACVGVLVITLFWYEILMPKLSMWRARRSARIREQRRTQAIELQKLKKSATRRCRNCLTPYRDQNPGGGKFMCSYCGHISKRPVLDLPGWQDWMGDSVSMSRYWVNESCLPEKSCSRVSVFGRRLVGSLVLSVRLVLTKVFRAGSRDGDSLEGESNGVLNKRGENGVSFHESRVEKAKRKAEEKRQARLEREMLEEEERKQREEVARLVEERRRLRDEKMEAEKLRSKESLSVDGERESRRETERRRRERRREKDKGSSKSNSDGEELEKRASRESEKKREFDKKSEIERQKAMIEILKLQALEGNKVAVSKNRYFDRMKGTFLSSRGFNGSSFFGRNAQAAVTINKVSKPAVGFVDHGHNSGIKKDVHSAGNVIGKSTASGDHQPVGADVQPWTDVPKKSWHQLFARSSAVSPDPDASNIMFGNLNCPLEATIANDKVLVPNYSVDNQFNFGQSLPYAGYSSPSGSLNGDVVFNTSVDSMFPPIKEPTHSPVIEDLELFEDPCYVPDSSSLLRPMPDHLDKFPLDLGTGFIDNSKVEGPRVLKNVSATAEVSKPSPIESPLSRLRVSEERQVLCTPNIQKNVSESDDLGNPRDSGTWQMWGTPLAGDGLGLAGGPSNWFSPLIQSNCNQEDATHPLGHIPAISHIVKGSPVPSVLTPQKSSVGNLQNAGAFSPVRPGLNGNDPWLQDELVQISGTPSIVKKALYDISTRLHQHPRKDNPPVDDLIYASTQGLFQPDASMPLPLHGNHMWSHHQRDTYGSSQPPPSFGGYRNEPSGYAHGSYSNSRISNVEEIPEEFSMRILCPTGKIGGVIGKAGASVRQLEHDTQARIQVEDTTPEAEERIVNVSSREGPWDRISPTIEAILQLQARTSAGSEDGVITTRLLVPSSKVGCLLGQGGNVINEMRKRTRADIKVCTKEDKPNYIAANEELVQISGNHDVAREALVEIASRLRARTFRSGNSSQHPAPMLPDHGFVPSERMSSRVPPSHITGDPGYPPPQYSGHGFVPRESFPSRGPPSAGMTRAGGAGGYEYPKGPGPAYDAKGYPPGPAGPIYEARGHPPAPAGPIYDKGYTSNQAGPRYESQGYPPGPPPTATGYPNMSSSTMEIKIPNSAVSSVLGVGGRNISEIRQISGARVKLHDPLPGSLESVVEIHGSSEQLQAAQSLLQAFVASGGQNAPQPSMQPPPVYRHY